MEERDRPEEVFLALPVPRHQLEPTTKFKTTWLVSSQTALHERGDFERYWARVPEEHRETLSSPVVGGWAPIEAAAAHYRACDELGFTTAEQVAIGHAVTDRLNHTLLANAIRLASHAGADVWTVLGLFNRFWERMFVGGGGIIYKLGPKESRLEVLGCRLADIPYFRYGLQGVLQGIGGLFCTKLYVSEVRSAAEGSPLRIVYRGSWV
jgi:hypothetical protein